MVDSLLVVGTLGGGGIHRYVEAQVEHLEDDLAVAVHDMYSDPKGSGVLWAVRSFLLAVLAAARFTVRPPPAVVHVHTSHRYSFYRASFYVLVAAHLWRRPVVLHVHGSSFDEFLATDSPTVGRLQSLVFEASDRVIVLSEHWRALLEPHLDPAKLRVVPNAVDPDEYDPTYDADPPHVVFLSNLVARKGVAELASALDTLAERDRRFEATVAGTGPLADRAEALAERHDRIRYVGFVSEERKHRLLDAGTIYVLPTYAEGLPIAMLEGMAGGNAVVSTHVGSIPEVIGDDNGLLVAPGDAGALTTALESLVESPDRAASMGRANHRLVRERYAWSATVPLLKEIYDDLTGDEETRRIEPAAARPE